MQLVVPGIVSSLILISFFITPAWAKEPICAELKPSSIPILLSADATFDNQVILTWTKSDSPLTHYLIYYGGEPNNTTYISPNVDHSKTTYTIKSLSGGSAYYFKVRAVNGCMEGDYSNELSALTTGAIIDTEAPGFTQINSYEDTSSSDDIKGEETEGQKLTELVDNNRGLLSILSAFAAAATLYYFFVINP